MKIMSSLYSHHEICSLLCSPTLNRDRSSSTLTCLSQLLFQSKSQSETYTCPCLLPGRGLDFDWIYLVGPALSLTLSTLSPPT